MRIAPKIELSARQREFLEHLVRSPTAQQRLVQRARIVLAAAAGGLNRDLAQALGVDAGTVGRWRRRWAAARPRLQAVEESADPADLRRGIIETLVDAPRSGRPGRFTPEQILDILLLACEPPEASQRPISHWTPRELADEAVKRKIVPSISARTVGRFLKSGGPETPPDPRLARPGARGSGRVSPAGVGGLCSV